MSYEDNSSPTKEPTNPYCDPDAETAAFIIREYGKAAAQERWHWLSYKKIFDIASRRRKPRTARRAAA